MGSITSRCSEKEPAFRFVGEAADIEPGFARVSDESTNFLTEPHFVFYEKTVNEATADPIKFNLTIRK